MLIINEKAIIEEAKEIQARIRKTRSVRALRAFATGINDIKVRRMETAAIPVKIRLKDQEISRLWKVVTTKLIG